MNFRRIIFFSIVSISVFLSGNGFVSAQVWEIFQAYQGDDVDALYESNSKNPLGGLFAKGFTRTFTLLGGVNFNSIDDPDLSSQLLPSTGANPIFESAIATIANPNSPALEFDDAGYALSAAMGRRHSHRLRSEIEFAIRGNEFDLGVPSFFGGTDEASTEIRAYSLMKNFVYELPNQTRFTPYGGAGLGISFIDIDTSASPFIADGAFSDDDTAFSWQVIAGVSARLNHAADFIFEYRYFATSDLELNFTQAEVPYQANNLFMGLKLEY